MTDKQEARGGGDSRLPAASTPVPNMSVAMNWLDILLLTLAGLGFLKGLFDGVVKQVVSLIAFIAAVLLCTEVAMWLRGYVLALGLFPENGVTVVSYILGFILVLLLFNVAGYWISRLVDATPLSVLNHIGGGFLGLLFILFFSSLALNVVEHIDPGSVLIPMEAKVESHLYYAVVEIVPTLFPVALFKL